MLAVEDLELKFSDKPLFRGVSFRLNEGQRIALAGRNGQGKTTLFRVIAGEVLPEKGSVSLAKGKRVGYLPQDVKPPEHERPVIEELLSAVPELRELEAEVERLAHEVAEAPEDEQLLRAYGRAQTRLEGLDAWGLEAKARTILNGLGFSQARMDGSLRALSGGWLMRVHLAKLLLSQPDLLLLDEPTNHLDIETREWLLELLKGFPGGVLLTSHDRYFLDALVHKVLELESGKLETYAGNYSAYEAEREERLTRLKASFERQQKEIAELEQWIESHRAHANTASRAQSKIKQLERIERIVLPPEPPRIRLRFPDPPRSGATALRLAGVGKAYGETVVFRGLDLELAAGKKLVVTGVNGAGKTTLLKLLSGRDQPGEGALELGHGVTLQYFSQYEDDVRDPSRTLLQVLEEVMPKDAAVPARTVLGCFLFSGDDVHKPVRVLSGGERARLKIAKMLVCPSNLLVLDEPTNHLDIRSQDLLLQALKDFPGTVVFVSHDRQFIRALADEVLELKDGRARHWPCDYETYRWRLAQEKAAAAAAAAPSPRAAAPAPAPTRPAAKAAPQPAASGPVDKKTLRRLQKTVDDLQARLEQDEARQALLEQLMCEPGFFQDQTRSRPVLEEHEGLKLAIERGYEELEVALQALELAGG